MELEASEGVLEEKQEFREYKYSVELKESAKKEKYIGSIKVRGDTIEELQEGINKVKDFVVKTWGQQ